MIERASAVITRDKKLLLVTGYDESAYWTPGGKVHDGESYEEALRRELKEELGVELVSHRPCIKYVTARFKFSGAFKPTDEEYRVSCYLVDIKGEIVPHAEITKIFWYGREDFERDTPKLLSKSMKEYLLPSL